MAKETRSRSKKLNDSERGFVIAEQDAVIDLQFLVLDTLKEKSLSKKDLAERLGVSSARVSQLFSAEANLTLRQIGRIFHALGETVQFGTAGQKNPIKEKRELFESLLLRQNWIDSARTQTRVYSTKFGCANENEESRVKKAA